MGRRPGPGLTRAQVVAAAIASVEMQGPAGLAITPVAKRLGIKPPSLYNHVRGAEDLRDAVLIEGHTQTLAAMRAAIRGVYEPVAVLTALANGVRQWALANPGLYETMARVPPELGHPQIGPLIVDLLDLFRAPLAALGIEDDEAVHAMRAIRSSMHGFLLLEIAGQFRLGQSTEESYARLLQTTLRGLTG